jgi:hypothetical protein
MASYDVINGVLYKQQPNGTEEQIFNGVLVRWNEAASGGTTSPEVWVLVSGVWKRVTNVYVLDEGEWKEVTSEIDVLVSGAWKTVAWS